MLSLLRLCYSLRLFYNGSITATLTLKQMFLMFALTSRAEEWIYGAWKISSQYYCLRNPMENFTREILTLCSG